MIDGPFYGMPMQQTGYTGDQSYPRRMAGSKQKIPFGAAFVWASVGLTVTFTVVVLALLMQVRGLKSDFKSVEGDLTVTSDEVATLQRAFQRIESAQPQTPSERSNLKTRSAPIPLVLNDGEIRLVHQFIRVIPSQSGAQQKLKVGDELSESASLPVPYTLGERLPKLQGARFAIDQNGAIVIARAGSNYVDVVIAQTASLTPIQ